MATITEVVTVDQFTILEVEQATWANPSILTFDERRRIDLTDDTVIDIVLLGDGFTTNDRGAFDAHISAWYDTFATLWPYSQFLSAFRVRAVFVASNERASAQRQSFYGIDVTADNEVGADMENDATFKQALYDTLAVLQAERGLNTRQYPERLKLGWSGDDPDTPSGVPTARDDPAYSDLCRNVVVAMAVYRDPGTTVLSGYWTKVNSPEGHELANLKIAVALGQNFLHEFSHAFALLLDEYIDRRDEWGKQRQNPSHPSVFELWNLIFSAVGADAPWRHLAWDRLTQRSSDSYVGQMWIGGYGNERGVWHSEYKCLMNGGHNNYHHSTDEMRDPANLRTRGRFCLWCEEIVTIRILEKTDALRRAGDPEEPDSINELGQIWYWRWVDELRAHYWQVFNLGKRILEREEYYKEAQNLAVPNVWDGDLTKTDLIREITQKPHPGVAFPLLFT